MTSRYRFAFSLVMICVLMAGLMGCAGAKTVEIDPVQLPANFRVNFDKAYPGATITAVEKETYPDGTVHYELEFTTQHGVEKELEFSADGEELYEEED